MKEYKLFILGTFVAIFALYFITYSSYENSSDYEHLSLDDKFFFFNNLNDEQKEGIASTSIDSLKASFFEDSLTYKRIKSLSDETYKSYQKISRDSLDIEQTLHIYRRLILILCLEC